MKAATRRHVRGGLQRLAFFMVVTACKTAEPGASKPRPPLVVIPECDFDVQTLWTRTPPPRGGTNFDLL